MCNCVLQNEDVGSALCMYELLYITNNNKSERCTDHGPKTQFQESLNTSQFMNEGSPKIKKNELIQGDPWKADEL